MMGECPVTLKWMYGDFRFMKLAYADPMRWSKEMPMYALRQDLTGTTGQYRDNRPVFLKMQCSQILKGRTAEESRIHFETFIDPKIKEMEARPFPDGAAALRAIDEGLLPLFDFLGHMPEPDKSESSHDTPTMIEKTEERAISLPQLWGLWAAVVAHSASWLSFNMETKEHEPLTKRAEEVNLYELNDNWVLPQTAPHKCSYVELVADGPQPPLWFISHWYTHCPCCRLSQRIQIVYPSSELSCRWGEPLWKTLGCITLHARLRQLGTGPYWYLQLF